MQTLFGPAKLNLATTVHYNPLQYRSSSRTLLVRWAGCLQQSAAAACIPVSASAPPCSSMHVQPSSVVQHAGILVWQQHMSGPNRLLCSGSARTSRTSLHVAWTHSSSSSSVHSSHMFTPPHGLSSNTPNSSSMAVYLPPGVPHMLLPGHRLQHVRCAAFGSSKGGSSSSKPKTQYVCQNCGAGEGGPLCAQAQHLVLLTAPRRVCLLDPVPLVTSSLLSFKAPPVPTSLLHPSTLAHHPVPNNNPTVYPQWLGKCRGCGEFGTIQEQTLAAAPASTADYAAALLRGRSNGSSGGTAAGSTGSRRAGGGGRPASAAVDIDNDFAAAAADPFNHLGPDYATDFANDGADDGFGYSLPTNGRGSSRALVDSLRQQSAAGLWVGQQQQQQHGSNEPQRLADIQCSAEDMRLPLFGATGEEVRAGGRVCACVCVCAKQRRDPYTPYDPAGAVRWCSWCRRWHPLGGGQGRGDRGGEGGVCFGRRREGTPASVLRWFVVMAVVKGRGRPVWRELPLCATSPAAHACWGQG